MMMNQIENIYTHTNQKGQGQPTRDCEEISEDRNKRYFQNDKTREFKILAMEQQAHAKKVQEQSQ